MLQWLRLGYFNVMIIALVQVHYFIVSGYFLKQINKTHAILHPSAGEYFASYCDVSPPGGEVTGVGTLKVIYFLLRTNNKRFIIVFLFSVGR